MYGRKAPYDNCQIFVKLYNDYANREYILREFDNNKNAIDRTLNRCAFDASSFISEKFKLGKPTSGDENDCSGPNFLLEQHLSNLTNSLQNKAFDSDNIENINYTLEQNGTSQCTASADRSTYGSIIVDRIEEAIQQETAMASTSSCSAFNLDRDDGNIADKLDRIQRRKRRLSDTVDYEEEYEWETTKYFE